jgi:ketosteroid isomerase-like protein
LLPLGGATRRDLIQRLAQPFDPIAPELREFIEEQDAMVREGSRMFLDHAARSESRRLEQDAAMQPS